MLTSEEYVADNGTRCPFCGGWHFSGGSFDSFDGRAMQDLFCFDCEKSWRDIYVLDRFEVIKGG